MDPEKQEFVVEIAVPPPAYCHADDAQPPPRYCLRNDGDDEWQAIMRRPFYQRWGYIVHSWATVLSDGRWVFGACLLIVILLIMIIVTVIVGIVPSQVAK